jgi:hypothetical protein
MSNHKEGISAWDVHKWVRVVEKDYHCRVHYYIALPMREGTGVCLIVRVAAIRYAVGAQQVWERGVSSQWPTNDAKTFMGLLFKMILQLELILAREFGGNGEATTPSQGRFDL